MNDLIAFHQDSIARFLIILNALVCSVIVIRLLTFKRDGARHKAWGGFLAWALIVLYSWRPITLVMEMIQGQVHMAIDWTQIGINVVMMIALLRLKGNVMQLFKMAGTPRRQH